MDAHLDPSDILNLFTGTTFETLCGHPEDMYVCLRLNGPTRRPYVRLRLNGSLYVRLRLNALVYHQIEWSY